MRNLICSALASVLICSCLSKQIKASDSSDIALIKQQADAWDAAIVAKDESAVSANMSDDFLQIDSSGNLSNKAEFLRGILSPDLIIAPYTVDELQIRIYGNTAIINGETDMHGTYKGKPFRTHYRFTDTYVRQGAKWKVVNVQTTEIAEPHA